LFGRMKTVPGNSSAIFLIQANHPQNNNSLVRVIFSLLLSPKEK